MIHIRLKGGMGNQMFQYAFGLAQAARLHTELKVDCSALLDRAKGKDFVYRDYDLVLYKMQADFVMAPARLRSIYKVKSSRLSRMVKKYAQNGLPLENEKHFHVDEQLISNPLDEVVYNGWWQSEKYFANVRDQVREAFAFRDSILPESHELLSKIEGTNSICLNVRRTDFLTTPTLNATNLAYFNKGAKMMSEMVDDPHFFVFSDDTAWCKENLKFDHPTQVVEHDAKGFKFGNYLQLMKACHHFIIPNSSFAWWAVWLNEHDDKKVIAPKNWFNEGDYDTSDLIPEDWLRV